MADERHSGEEVRPHRVVVSIRRAGHDPATDLYSASVTEAADPRDSGVPEPGVPHFVTTAPPRPYEEVVEEVIEALRRHLLERER